MGECRIGIGPHDIGTFNDAYESFEVQNDLSVRTRYHQLNGTRQVYTGNLDLVAVGKVGQRLYIPDGGHVKH